MADDPIRPGLIQPESYAPKAVQYVSDRVTNTVRIKEGHSQIALLVNAQLSNPTAGYQSPSSIFDNTNWKGITVTTDAFYNSGNTPFQCELWATWYMEPRSFTWNEVSPFYCLMRSPVITQNMRVNMTLYPGAPEIPYISTDAVLPRYFFVRIFAHDSAARDIEMQVNGNMLV